MTKKNDLAPIRKEIIAGKMERYELSNEAVATRLHVSLSKWYASKRNPEELDLGQLDKLKEILHLSNEEVFRFVTGIEFDSAFKTKANRLGLKVLAG